MRVKINGKEVEVGPSQHVQEKLEIPQNSLNQPTKRNEFNNFKLKINGREVDMNNPDDVQNAIRSCRIIGRISLVISIIALFMIGSGANWEDSYFTEDILGGAFAISIWIILGTVFTFFTPRALQKRLDELKKQGKFPTKN